MEYEKIIKRELEKIGIDYTSLKDSSKHKLELAEKIMANKSEENSDFIKKFAKHDYTISNMCLLMNLSRKVLYTDYPEVVKYINSRAEFYVIKDRSNSKKNINSLSEEKTMIENFVKRDVEYMELKSKVIDLERKVKSLTLEKTMLEKKISTYASEKNDLNNETSIKSNKS